MKKQKNKNSKVRTALHVLLAGVAAATVTTPIVLNNMDQSSVEVEQKKQTEGIGYYSGLAYFSDYTQLTPFVFEGHTYAYIKESLTNDEHLAIIQPYLNDGYKLYQMDGMEITSYAGIATGYYLSNGINKIELVRKGVSIRGGIGSVSLTCQMDTINYIGGNMTGDEARLNRVALDFNEDGKVDQQDADIGLITINECSEQTWKYLDNLISGFELNIYDGEYSSFGDLLNDIIKKFQVIKQRTIVRSNYVVDTRNQLGLVTDYSYTESEEEILYVTGNYQAMVNGITKMENFDSYDLSTCTLNVDEIIRTQREFDALEDTTGNYAPMFNFRLKSENLTITVAVDTLNIVENPIESSKTITYKGETIKYFQNVPNASGSWSYDTLLNFRNRLDMSPAYTYQYGHISNDGEFVKNDVQDDSQTIRPGDAIRYYDVDGNVIDTIAWFDYGSQAVNDGAVYNVVNGVATKVGEPTLTAITNYDLNGDGIIQVSEYLVINPTANVLGDAEGNFIALLSVDNLGTLDYWSEDFTNNSITELVNKIEITRNSLLDGQVVSDTAVYYYRYTFSNGEYVDSFELLDLASLKELSTGNKYCTKLEVNLGKDVNGHDIVANISFDAKAQLQEMNFEGKYTFTSADFNLETFKMNISNITGGVDTRGDALVITMPELDDLTQDDFLKSTNLMVNVYVAISSTKENLLVGTFILKVTDNDLVINVRETNHTFDIAEIEKLSNLEYAEAVTELNKIYGVSATSSNGLRSLNGSYPILNGTNVNFVAKVNGTVQPGTYTLTSTVYDELSGKSVSVDLTYVIRENASIPDDSILLNRTEEYKLTSWNDDLDFIKNVNARWVQVLDTTTTMLNALDGKVDTRGNSIVNIRVKDYDQVISSLINIQTYSITYLAETSTGDVEFTVNIKLGFNNPTINASTDLETIGVEQLASLNLASIFNIEAFDSFNRNVTDNLVFLGDEDYMSSRGGTYTITATVTDSITHLSFNKEFTLNIAVEEPTVYYVNDVVHTYKVGTTLEDIVSKSVVFRDVYLEEDNKLTSAGSFDEIDISVPGEYELTVTYTNKYDKSVSAKFKFEIVNRIVEEFVNLESNYNINLSDVINGVNISDYLKDVKFLGIHDEELEFEVIIQAFDNLLDLVELIKEHYETGAHTGGLSNYDFEKPMNAVVSAPGISQEFTITIIPDTKPFVHGGELNLSYITTNQSKIALVDFLKQFNISVEDWIDGSITDFKIIETDYKSGVVGEYTFTLEFTNSAGLSYSCVNKIEVIDATAPVNTDGIKPIYYTYKKQDVYAILNGIYMVDDTDGVITDYVVSRDNYSGATEYGTYQVEVTFANKAGLKTYATTTICYQKKVSFWQRIKNWFKKVDNSSFGQFWRHPIAKIKSWF